MKLHAPMRYMNMGHGRWLVNSRVDSNLPAKARSVGRSTFQAEYMLSSLYLYQYSYSLVVHIAEDYELLHSTSTKSPIHYTVILGVPILYVPTLIGLKDFLGCGVMSSTDCSLFLFLFCVSFLFLCSLRFSLIVLLHSQHHS